MSFFIGVELFSAYTIYLIETLTNNVEQDVLMDVIEPLSYCRKCIIVAVTIFNASTVFFYTLTYYLPTDNTLGLGALHMIIIQCFTPGFLVLISGYIFPKLIRQGFSSSKSSLLLTLVQSFNVIIVPLCTSFILGKAFLPKGRGRLF